ncbi:hypothetical protein J6590_076966 [Homalodisca vitripennis]|nr:hypothetical protein J6590_076966 [Homalodisca vitripennis]
MDAAIFHIADITFVRHSIVSMKRSQNLCSDVVIEGWPRECQRVPYLLQKALLGRAVFFSVKGIFITLGRSTERSFSSRERTPLSE